MFEVEYLTDKNGQQKAVVLPIELWRQLFLKDDASIKELSEEIEDYCLSKAMDEAQNTPLLNHKEALAYLEE
ncbi:hypothetical protein DK28_0205595 [Peptococcaceae bacterium SCADC1_2_3]|nr:hypothetical protein DK28_0205595 [Peptococcaceae bacterium SCADC1_2_3]KFI36214.1 hypothetical protein HY00_06290 [Peptococcaceae bacterium SCADC1_2_3]